MAFLEASCPGPSVKEWIRVDFIGDSTLPAGVLPDIPMPRSLMKLGSLKQRLSQQLKLPLDLQRRRYVSNLHLCRRCSFQRRRADWELSAQLKIPHKIRVEAQETKGQ